MTNATALLPAPATTQRPFAWQRAALLGVRAAMTEQDVMVCDRHGRIDDDGHNEDGGVCDHRAGCDGGRETLASPELEDAIFALAQGRHRGAGLHEVARSMRRAKRRAMDEQERRDRDAELRCERMAGEG